MTKTSFSTDTVIEELDTAFNRMDEERVKELKFFEQLVLKKNDAQKRERDRLVKKYGKDHPRIKKLEMKVEYNEAFLPVLDAEISRIENNTEPFPADGWRAHGFVTEKGKIAPSATVVLANSQRQWEQGLPVGPTNEKGYYALTLTKDLLDKLKGKELFLAVMPDTRKNMYIMKEPLSVMAGQIDYIDLAIEELSTPAYKNDRPKKDKDKDAE